MVALVSTTHSHNTTPTRQVGGQRECTYNQRSQFLPHSSSFDSLKRNHSHAIPLPSSRGQQHADTQRCVMGAALTPTHATPHHTSSPPPSPLQQRHTTDSRHTTSERVKLFAEKLENSSRNSNLARDAGIRRTQQNHDSAKRVVSDVSDSASDAVPPSGTR
jgi:hypothetical protein